MEEEYGYPNDEDTGDPVVVKKKKTKAQLRRQREDEELKEILSTYGGRAFMWWLLEEASVYHTTFDSNPQVMSFLEGKRQMGLKVLNRLFETDPKAYERMRNEAVVRLNGERN